MSELNVRELRIGNYVSSELCDLSKEVLQVREIRVHGKLEIIITGAGWAKHEPIPLTEEWLVKFGKYLADGQYIININDYELNWDKETGLYIIKDGTQIELDHIKHVHQLQNLYFALTGEELELNV